MWRSVLIVLTLTLSTLAIRVPVDGKDDNESTTAVTPTKTTENVEEIYYVPENANLDSYLLPPDPHQLEEVLSDTIITPATYLLPPSPEKQVDYWGTTEAGEQTDWYPIPPASSPIAPLLSPRPPDVIPIMIGNNRPFEIIENPRHGKAYEGKRLTINAPSRQLEPPKKNRKNKYKIATPSKDLELPFQETNAKFSISHNSPENHKEILKPIHRHKINLKKNNIYLKEVDPTLALHLTPPRPSIIKNPTKLYPKKVSTEFKPVPIPIAQFAEESPEIPRARPVNPFNPVTSSESGYITSPDEKKNYLYQQAEQKRKLKAENDAIKQQLPVAAEDTYGDNASAEQETSGTTYRHNGRNVYPAPLRQAPPAAPPVQYNSQAPPPDERTEFRMHGMKGPHSYQFGFDTGKGKNRQFRYEERDNDGRVTGHYGYMDKSGKLRVVNYNADPEHGFHAEAPKDTQ